MKKTKKAPKKTKYTIEPPMEKKTVQSCESATGMDKSSKGERGSKAAKGEPKPKKLGILGAAAKVLEDSGKPMNCTDMVKTMLEKGIWRTQGKTPAATLSSAIIREIATAVQKAKKSRFRKVERGMFTLNK